MVTDKKLVPGAVDQRELSLPQRIRVLRELERQGYIVQPPIDDLPGVTICRHPISPALSVGNDGRIELLDVQADPRGLMLTQAPTKHIHWGRGLFFLTSLGVATFLGLLVVAMIVG